MNYSFPPSASRTSDVKNIPPAEVLFVAEDSLWGRLGYEIVSAAFQSVVPVLWSPGTPKPNLNNWYGDWIISFKSDLILSQAVLEKASKGAINIHPSPPKYRGVGGYWWALHNGDENFGVTCHHMDERIDHGTIIETTSFLIWPNDTVASIKYRASIYALTQLNEILNTIVSGKPLVTCGANWGQHLYTYQELALAKHKYELEMNSYNVQPSVEFRSALKTLEAMAQEDNSKNIENINKNHKSTKQRVA